ncbi:uncharacterized protein LOC131656358 [Vicia villosa]|uniref:uncharacterized protein LOC131656358 n=1 Tax=Vicia villosa TaxID=3911 RepID=UPI00273CEFCD|nr:uncharacterized protein LOC131656358 [Vicia villosa]
MDDHKKKTLEPKPNLEELYQGIPDESVNLTFQDLPNVKKNTTNIQSPSLSPMNMSPTHDFKKGFKVYSNDNYNHQQDFGHRGVVGAQGTQSKASENNLGYDTMSGESSSTNGKGGVGRRRRQGIPHSKICTICSNYVYFFRTRCLVCGRVYCKQCVEIGMGDLREGRKCVNCLGLRFCQRYIERAGLLGCLNWRYPSTVKQTELKWAEKGPRRNGDKGYGNQSRPTTPTTPTSPFSIASSEASFATYSPFTPRHHHHPL